MEIMVYTEEFKKSYEDYTRKNTKIIFFYSLKYINFLVELLNAKNETLLVVNNNEVVGILPMLSRSGKYGKVINSLPHYGSNGYIIADSSAGYSCLLNYYNKLVQSSEVFSSTVITNPLVIYENLDTSVLFNYEDYRIGQVTDFGSVSSENLMDMFHHKTRNTIRKALKQNIEIYIGNSCFDFLEEVHNENMVEVGGIAKRSDFFSLIQKYFEPKIDYNIYVAEYNGIKIAALLVFYFNETVEYYTPVVKNEYRNMQSLSAIIYMAMQEAIDNNYKNWNWGGTWATQDGVYRFKKRWGTQDLKYYYFTQLNYDIDKLRKNDLLNEYENFYTVPFNDMN